MRTRRSAPNTLRSRILGRALSASMLQVYRHDSQSSDTEEEATTPSSDPKKKSVETVGAWLVSYCLILSAYAYAMRRARKAFLLDVLLSWQLKHANAAAHPHQNRATRNAHCRVLSGSDCLLHR